MCTTPTTLVKNPRKFERIKQRTQNTTQGAEGVAGLSSGRTEFGICPYGLKRLGDSALGVL